MSKDVYSNMEEAGISQWDDHWHEGWKTRRYAMPLTMVLATSAVLVSVYMLVRFSLT